MAFSLPVVRPMARVRDYQEFSELSLLFLLYGVVKYMFLFFLYDLFISLVSNIRICLDVLIYYKAKGRSNLISFFNQDVINLCCLKFTCKLYNYIRSYHTEHTVFCVLYKG